MNKAQRKRHFQIWTAWALLLPLGMIAAVLAVQQPAKDQPVGRSVPAALPLVIKSKTEEGFDVKLRSNALRTQWQLEWVNKKELTAPTALIYLGSTKMHDVNEAELLGRIDSKGTYIFNITADDPVLHEPELRVFVYDFIHQVIIQKINF
jgi:hypothetical protein